MSQWMQCSFIQTVPIWADSACNIGDTHDGGRKPWYQKIEKSEVDKRAKEYRSSRERLRDDIVFAMDGPIEGEVLDVIRAELDPEDFAKFGAPDYEPELRGLLSQTEALRKLAMLVLEERARVEMEMAEQDDEESIMLLLN